MRAPIRWAIEWQGGSPSDRYFLWAGRNPLIFPTREEARRHIAKHYGYIANRPDLQSAPHHWRTPRPVKVRVVLEAA